MRYSDKARAAALWTTHFGPLQGVLAAPSKALVFSEIYDLERARDPSHFLNALKSFRCFNPLVTVRMRMLSSPLGPASDHDAENSNLVFHAGDLCAWAEAWVKALHSMATTEERVDNRSHSQQELRDLFVAHAARVAARLNDPLAVLKTSPLRLCALALKLPTALPTAAEYQALPANVRLSLAGLCGLLHVWRMRCAYQYPIEQIPTLPAAEVEQLLEATTMSELMQLDAPLETMAREHPTSHSVSTMLAYLRQHIELYSLLSQDFFEFQHAVIGRPVYFWCL